MKQLLYFSAEWCGPCRTFKPTMEALSKEIPIQFIDVDISANTSQNYNVRSVPTTILIKDGIEVGRLIGPKSMNEIRDLFRA
jgi:thioredoxin-like negative regulator of GroEL